MGGEGGIEMRRFVLLVLLATGMCGAAKANLIGSFTESAQFGTAKILNAVDIDIIFGDPAFDHERLFDSQTFTPADSGTEVFATSPTGAWPDPVFGYAVASLTDGIDNQNWVGDDAGSFPWGQ